MMLSMFTLGSVNKEVLKKRLFPMKGHGVLPDGTCVYNICSIYIIYILWNMFTYFTIKSKPNVRDSWSSSVCVCVTYIEYHHFFR